MKITKGEMLQRYADIKELDIEHVLDWVNAYVNTPDQFHHPELIEATEKERFQSIKAFIVREIENSTTGRIRTSIDSERRKAA